MTTKYPAHLESDFRKYLGNINPYLQLIDVATREFASVDKSKMHDAARNHGHYNVSFNEINSDKLKQFVYLSHLAFINSRADFLCRDISDFCDIEYSKFPGDTLRKIIAVIHVYNSPDKQKSTGEVKKSGDDSIILEYVGKTELNIVDYYRNIRNSEFHGGLENNWKTKDNLSDESRNDIESLYKFRPSEFNQLCIQDVILYSKAWQKIAYTLCSKLFNFDHIKGSILEALKKKHFGKPPQRRKNAIVQALKQRYLLSDEQIATLMTEID